MWEWSLDPITLHVLELCWEPPDHTAPIAADVKAKQADYRSITANWREFEDEESGIKNYEVCVGTSAGADDIFACKDVGKDLSAVLTKNLAPWDGREAHVLVRAHNTGGLSTGSFAPVIRLDTSPPRISGLTVHRGLDGRPVPSHASDARVLTSNPRLITATFTVEEPSDSGILEVSVAAGTQPASSSATRDTVGIRDARDFASVGNTQALSTKSTTPITVAVQELPSTGDIFEHAQTYHLTFFTLNTLGIRGLLSSAEIFVDLTPPVLADNPEGYVRHGPSSLPAGSRVRYFKYKDVYETSWGGFSDPETSIHGYQWRYFDADTGDELLGWTDASQSTSARVSRQPMLHAHSYRTEVRATNNAGLYTDVVSSAVVVDTTPPICADGLKDIDPSGRVDDWEATYIMDRLEVQFDCADPESGITSFQVAVGTYPGGQDVLPYEDVDEVSTEEGSELNEPEFAEHPAAVPRTYDPIVGTIRSPEFVPVHGMRFYANIIAADGAGWVDVAFSTGVVFDETPPRHVAWRVADGSIDLEDRNFTRRTDTLSATWLYAFVDPESSIESYRVGVGSEPGLADVAAFVDVGSAMRHTFRGLHLLHASMYFVTVVAYNHATNSAAASTNGVMVDLTPAAVVSGPFDGSAFNVFFDAPDDRYSGFNTSFAATWAFEDPESGVDSYNVSLIDATSGAVVVPPRMVEKRTTVVLPTLPAILQHTGQYLTVVTATNGAGEVSSARSNGFIVDLTRPVVPAVVHVTAGSPPFPGTDLSEHSNIVRIITDVETDLTTWWEAFDPESGLRGVSVAVGSYVGGEDIRAWETVALPPIATNPSAISRRVYDLSLPSSAESPLWVNGQRTYVTLRAVNGAFLAASVSSDGVVCDFEPPVAGAVSDGWSDADSDFIGSRVHLRGKWRGFVDHETGIATMLIGVGTSPAEADIVPLHRAADGVNSSTATITGLSLQDGIRYYFLVAAVDHAGHVSDTAASDGVVVDTTPPVPGVVVEGVSDAPDASTDVDFQHFADSVVVSWSPFVDPESGILECQVGLGSSSGLDDVSPFRRVSGGSRVAMLTGLALKDGSRYVTTVVCVNGAGISAQASSDGLFVDSSPPSCKFSVDPAFAAATDTLLVSWVCTDPHSGIAASDMAVGLYGGGQDVVPFAPVGAASSAPDEGLVMQLDDGLLYFLSLRLRNRAGLGAVVVAPPLSIDRSPPVAAYVRVGMAPQDLAAWGSADIPAYWRFVDRESEIRNYEVGVGLSVDVADVVALRDAPLEGSDVVRLPDSFVAASPNTVIYIVVRAFNHAGRSVTNSSRAIQLDLTPPTCTYVWDGTGLSGADSQFEASRKFVSAVWDCADDGSGIADFSVSVRSDATSGGESVVGPWLSVGTAMSFVGPHEAVPGVRTYVVVRATNHAGASAEFSSDGFVVDLTAPAFFGPITAPRYSTSTAELTVSWTVLDVESGIRACELALYDAAGAEQRPFSNDGVVETGSAGPGPTHTASLVGLSLNVATTTLAKVRCINFAGTSATQEGAGTTIDQTPPTGGAAAIRALYPHGFDSQPTFPNSVTGVSILVSWANFRDGESSIASVEIGLGMNPNGGDAGATDISGGFVAVSADPLTGEARIDNIELPNFSTVFATVRALNGVGLSTVAVSPGLPVALRALVAGEVADGAQCSADGSAVDIDVQRASTGAWASWTGFSDPSDAPGGLSYEVALGTAEFGTDIVPFVSVGDAQCWHRLQELELVAGTKYFVTVRATNTLGATVSATSDGFVVDSSAPEIEFVRMGLPGVPGISGPLQAHWLASDVHSRVVSQSLLFGTEPYLGDIMPATPVAVADSQFTAGPELPAAAFQGVTVFATLQIVDASGLSTEAFSVKGAVVDGTPPVGPVVFDGSTASTDAQTLSALDAVVAATWEACTDTETGIVEYHWCVGTAPGLDDLLACRSVGMELQAAAGPADDAISALLATDGRMMFSTVKCVNGAGLSTESYSDGVIVDVDAPRAGEVALGDFDELYDPDHLAAVHSSENAFVPVAWRGFDDGTAGSGLQQVSVCLASSRGSAELRPACDVVAETSTPHATPAGDFILFGDVPVPDGQYFIVVTALDAAGHVAFAVSQLVVIDTAPPHVAEVVDGPGELSDPDIDFLEDGSTVTVRIRDVSDGASGSGVATLELALCDSTGYCALDFGPIPVDSSSVTIERPPLQLGVLTHARVRVTDATGLSFVAESDGFVFDDTPPIPAEVADGQLCPECTSRSGILADIEFVAEFNPATAISAHWRPFVDGESGVVSYAWCVGSVVGACDVVPRTELGLSLSASYVGYSPPVAVSAGRRFAFATVWGCNAVGLCAASMSNGVAEDASAPQAGRVTTASLPAGALASPVADTLSFEWEGFSDRESGISHFVVGVVEHGGDAASATQMLDSSATSVTLTGLSLVDGNAYRASVTAFDSVGRSVEVLSAAVQVDSSPPELLTPKILLLDGDGIPLNLGVADGGAVFVPALSSVSAMWPGIVDLESGVAEYTWNVCNVAGVCLRQEFASTGIQTMASDASLVLSPSQQYRVHVRARNFAGLVAEHVSDSFGSDDSPPEAGTVIDGHGSGFKHHASFAAVAASWSGFFDVESGIRAYHVCAGTAAGLCDVVPSTNVSTATSAEFRVDPATLPQGGDASIVFSVTAVNGAGLSTTAASVGARVDTSPPSPFAVVVLPPPTGAADSTTGTDAAAAAVEFARVESLAASRGIDPSGMAVYTSDTERINFHWEAALDDETGICSYEYAVGTAPLADDVLARAFAGRTGNQLSLSDVAVTLQHGGSYFVTVWATNCAGLSSVAVSPRYVVDQSPPSLGEVFDGEGSDPDDDVDFVNGALMHGWWRGFADDESGSDGLTYFVELREEASGAVVDSWSVTNGARSVSASQLFVPGHAYALSVRARNAAGLESEVAHSDGFVVESIDRISGQARDVAAEADIDSADIDFRASLSQVRAAWPEAFQPATEGAAESSTSAATATFTSFEWCIGRATEVCDVMSMTPVGDARFGEATVADFDVDANPLGAAASPIAANSSAPLPYFVVTVRGTTQSGLVATTSTDGFAVDVTPPTIDRLSVVDAWQVDPATGARVLSRVTPSAAGDEPAHWFVGSGTTGFVVLELAVSDPHSGVSGCLVTIGHGSDTPSTPLTVLLDSSTSSGTVDIRMTDLTARGSTTAVLLECANGAGSVTSSSVVLHLDETPPLPGAVLDGDGTIEDDIDFVGDTTRVVARWSGFDEPESEVIYYSWTLFAMPEGTDRLDSVTPLLPLSHVGNSTSVYVTGLQLAEGSTYYVFVRACNSHMLCTDVTSDGFVVATADPCVANVRAVDVAAAARAAELLPSSSTSVISTSSPPYVTGEDVIGAVFRSSVRADVDNSTRQLCVRRGQGSGDDGQGGRVVDGAVGSPVVRFDWEVRADGNTHNVSGLPDGEAGETALPTSPAPISPFDEPWRTAPEAVAWPGAKVDVAAHDSACCSSLGEWHPQTNAEFDAAVVTSSNGATATVAVPGPQPLFAMVSSPTGLLSLVTFGALEIVEDAIDVLSTASLPQSAAAGAAWGLAAAEDHVVVAVAGHGVWAFELDSEKFSPSAPLVLSAAGTVHGSVDAAGSNVVVLTSAGVETFDLSGVAAGATVQPASTLAVGAGACDAAAAAVGVAGNLVGVASGDCSPAVDGPCLRVAQLAAGATLPPQWTSTVALGVGGSVCSAASLGLTADVAAVGLAGHSLSIVSVSSAATGGRLACSFEGDGLGYGVAARREGPGSPIVSVAAWEEGDSHWAAGVVKVDADLAADAANAPEASVGPGRACARIATVASAPIDAGHPAVGSLALSGSLLAGLAPTTGPVAVSAYCNPGQVRVASPGGAHGLPVTCSPCPDGQTSSGGLVGRCESCDGHLCAPPDARSFAAYANLTDVPEGASFVDGLHYRVRVTAVAASGRTSIAQGEGFVVDSSPPFGGRVFDGGFSSGANARGVNASLSTAEPVAGDAQIDGESSDEQASRANLNASRGSVDTGECNGAACGVDIDFQQSTTRLLANWAGWADADSGVEAYTWCIGTAARLCDVVPQTAAGLNYSVEVDGLALHQGVTYFTTVTAANGAGLTASAVSDGVTVDRTPPVMLAVRDGIGAYDVDTQTYLDSLFGSWDARDEEAQDALLYEYSVGVTPGGAEVLTPSITAEASFAIFGAEHLEPNTTYYTSVRAIGPTGLISEWMHSDGIVVGKSEGVANPTEETVIGFDLLNLADESSPAQGDGDREAITVGAVVIPPGAVSTPTRIVAGVLARDAADDAADVSDPSTEAPPQDNFLWGNYTFTVTAVDNDGNRIDGFHFDAPIQIVLFYNADGAAASAPVDLGSRGATGLGPVVMFYSTIEQRWMDVRDTCPERRWEVDAERMTLTVDVCHLTQFGIWYQQRPVAELNVDSNSVLHHLQAPNDATLRRNPHRFALSAGQPGDADAVELDGSGSYDPDGTVDRVYWRYLSGPSWASGTVIAEGGVPGSPAPSVALGAPALPVSFGSWAANYSAVNATGGDAAAVAAAEVLGALPVTAAAGVDAARPASLRLWSLPAGTHVIGLRVEDNDGGRDDASVAIRVNVPPTANAGNDVAVNVSSLPPSGIQLDGSASADPDGSLTLSWSVDGFVPDAADALCPIDVADTAEVLSGLSLDGATLFQPTLRGISRRGTYTVSLLVTDSDGRTDADTVNVTVTGGDAPAGACLLPPALPPAWNATFVAVDAGGVATDGRLWLAADGRARVDIDNNGAGPGVAAATRIVLPLDAVDFVLHVSRTSSPSGGYSTTCDVEPRGKGTCAAPDAFACAPELQPCQTACDAFDPMGPHFSIAPPSRCYAASPADGAGDGGVACIAPGMRAVVRGDGLPVSLLEEDCSDGSCDALRRVTFSEAAAGAPPDAVWAVEDAWQCFASDFAACSLFCHGRGLCQPAQPGVCACFEPTVWGGARCDVPVADHCELVWGEWGECNRECGGGTQRRTGAWVPRPGASDAIACPDSIGVEERTCNEHTCPGQTVCGNCGYGTSGPCIDPYSTVCYAAYAGTNGLCPAGTESCAAKCPVCAGGTSGPCLDASTGECSAYYPAGSVTCAPGLTRCQPLDDGQQQDPAQCAGCWPHTSGPCQNAANTVCYDYFPGTSTCAPGTSECAATGSAAALPLAVADVHVHGVAASGELEQLASPYGRLALRHAVADALGVDVDDVVIDSLAGNNVGLVVVARAQGEGEAAALVDALAKLVESGALSAALRENGFEGVDSVSLSGPVALVLRAPTTTAPPGASFSDDSGSLPSDDALAADDAVGAQELPGSDGARDAPLASSSVVLGAGGIAVAAVATALLVAVYVVRRRRAAKKSTDAVQPFKLRPSTSHRKGLGVAPSPHRVEPHSDAGRDDDDEFDGSDDDDDVDDRDDVARHRSRRGFGSGSTLRSGRDHNASARDVDLALDGGASLPGSTRALLGEADGSAASSGALTELDLGGDDDDDDVLRAAEPVPRLPQTSSGGSRRAWL